MKHLEKIAVFAVLAIIAATFAFAANDAAKEGTNNTTKNMTYGQCVSQAASLKNDGFAAAKDARTACKEQAADDKAKTKTCDADYKKAKADVKKGFKDAKKTCAQTYKPGAFAKMGSAFK
jgi:hypothetical protein